MYTLLETVSLPENNNRKIFGEFVADELSRLFGYCKKIFIIQA